MNATQQTQEEPHYVIKGPPDPKGAKKVPLSRRELEKKTPEDTLETRDIKTP